MDRSMLEGACGPGEVGTVLIVSHTPSLRRSLGLLFEAAGRRVELFETASELPPEAPKASCIVAETGSFDPSPRIDVLGPARTALPVIIVAGAAEVSRGLRALTSDAFDLFEIPFSPSDLLGSVDEAAAASSGGMAHSLGRQRGKLTLRERQVLEELVVGRSAKAIGKAIGISPRTVETHRARIMWKLSARSMADAVRIALETGMVAERMPAFGRRGGAVRRSDAGDGSSRGSAGRARAKAG